MAIVKKAYETADGRRFETCERAMMHVLKQFPPQHGPEFVWRHGKPYYALFPDGSQDYVECLPANTRQQYGLGGFEAIPKYKPATPSSVFEKRTPILPGVVADTVMQQRGIDCQSPEGNWFSEHVDHYVRWLHANKPDWKRKLEKSEDPRDFVYAFVNHWLDAYLKDPKRFKQMAKNVDLGCVEPAVFGEDNTTPPIPKNVDPQVWHAWGAVAVAESVQLLQTAGLELVRYNPDDPWAYAQFDAGPATFALAANDLARPEATRLVAQQLPVVLATLATFNGRNDVWYDDINRAVDRRFKSRSKYDCTVRQIIFGIIVHALRARNVWVHS